MNQKTDASAADPSGDVQCSMIPIIDPVTEETIG